MKIEFGPVLTNPELNKESSRRPCGGAVVIQTRCVFILCEKWSILSDGFVKTRCLKCSVFCHV